VKIDTVLHGINAGVSVPPTASPVPTRFTPFLPTAPRPPIRLYLYFIVHERAIHSLLFLSFAHR